MRGLGIDIVSVARIASLRERHGPRFLERCFRPDEIALARARGPRGDEVLASRWAAKEAFVKALGGPGLRVPLRDVEVVRGQDGAPTLRLHGAAAAALAAAGAARALVSLSHEHDHAVATVVLE